MAKCRDGENHRKRAHFPTGFARAPESRSAPAGARELVVVWRDIEALIPYARNARTHSDAQIAQIAGREDPKD
jgi:hypothetical protein